MEEGNKTQEMVLEKNFATWKIIYFVSYKINCKMD